MKVGDDFYRKKFGKGIRPKANLLLLIIAMLAIVVIEDKVGDMLFVDTTMLQHILSISIIFLTFFLCLIGYKFTRDLKEWEDTYKKVCKILK